MPPTMAAVPVDVRRQTAANGRPSPIAVARPEAELEQSETQILHPVGQLPITQLQPDIAQLDP